MIRRTVKSVVAVVDWRDFEEMSSRHDGKQQVLDELMETWSNTAGGSAAASASSLRSTHHRVYLVLYMMNDIA